MSKLGLRIGVKTRPAKIGRATPLRIAIAVFSTLTAASADRAYAADWALRGSVEPNYSRWDGVYGGLQAAGTWASADLSGASGSQIGYILANTELQGTVSSFTSLPKGTQGGVSYGFFLGYNYQVEEIVLGGELNYNHMSINVGAQDSQGPILIPGANLPDNSTVLYSVTVNSGASVTLTDVFTARARTGWAIDRYLPYAFVGLAVAIADVSLGTSVSGTKTTTPPPTIGPGGITIPGIPSTGALILPRSPQSLTRNHQIYYGYTAGLGLEIVLTQNLFFRSEWELIQFPNVSNFRVATNSARAGLGVKF